MPIFFSVVALILIELEFADVGFCGGRKTGEPKKIPEAQWKPTPKSPKNGTGSKSNSDHNGRRRALSSLLHRCSTSYG